MGAQFEIEDIFSITGRGVFVMVRLLDTSQSFSTLETAFLGGVELTSFLDIPRVIKEGQQKNDVYIMQIRNKEDLPKLRKGSIVELINL